MKKHLTIVLTVTLCIYATLFIMGCGGSGSDGSASISGSTRSTSGKATIIGYMVTALLWITLGLAMRALVVSGAYPELAKADHAAPEFLQHFTHPILAGVVLDRR